MKQIKQFLLVVALFTVFANVGWGQTPYVMSGGDYSEVFTNIANTTNWPDNFNGTDCAEWTSVAVNSTGTVGDGIKISTSTATFSTSSTGGVQRGTANIQLLSTSTTNSCAIDLCLDFTGRNAGTISFDAATVFNSSGTRDSKLKLFYSTDGTTFTEITGTNLPFTARNNVALSLSITSISLPTAFNNCSTARLRFYEYSTLGGATPQGSQPKISIDNITITSTASSTPTIITTGTLTAFSTAVNVPSSSQTYTVSGSSLSTNNIDITAPSMFEISTNSGTNWASTYSLVPSGGTVNTTTISVRYNPSAASTHSGNITHTSTGATQRDIAVSGTSFTNPTIQAYNINFASVLTSGLTVNWTIGNGAKRLVKMNTSNSFTDPTDGQADPGANTVYGGGEQVIYNNTSTTVPITGLSANTIYYFRVYEYNGTGATSKYLTTTGTNNPNSQTTPFAIPSPQTSTITFPDVQENQMTISWTSGNGSNRAVFVKELSGSVTNPSNGTTYTASSDWNSKGTELGTSKYYCVYNGTGNTITITNLSTGTLYIVQIFEYNGSGTGTVYNVTTATGNPNSQTTVNNVPTISVNPSTLTGFSTNAGTVSSAQSYTLSGSSLDPQDGNITVTAPANFEVSTDNNNYASSTTVAYAGGVLSNTTIYVRIASTSSVGTVTGNVSNNGGNVATPVNVSVTGFVYSATPSTQPTNISFNNVTTTTFDLSWTNGNGTNTIVLIKSSSAVDGNLVNGTSYPANTTFGSGTPIGTGNYVVYNSTGTSVSITGLSSSTTYYVALYSFNGSGGTENYFTTLPATGNQLTATPPAVTYTWVGADNGAWTTSTNWSPTRTTPATTDIMQFSDGTTKTIASVPTQTIGQLIVSGNTIVNLQCAIATLTVSGGAGTDLSVAAGSQLNFNGTSVLTMTLSTGVTGSILGSMTFTNAAHKLTSVDASGITFGSGSVFTAGTGFSNNAFGSGTNGSIIFSNNSTYVGAAGGSPFGSAAANVVVTFQTGSLFKVTQNAVPSFSGRTYANFEINLTAYNQSSTGTNPFTVDDLTITAGSPNINLTGQINIKGKLKVLSGATLTFNPVSTGGSINFNGTSQQTITNSGTLTFGSNSALSITNNTSGVLLQSNINIGSVTCSVSGILDCGANIISGTLGNFTLVSGGTLKTANSAGLTGSITVTGTKTFDSGANYEFNGTSTGTLSTLNNLTVNNSSGNVALGSNLTVNGTLTFTNGKLTLGTNNLTLGSSATVSGVTAGNYIVADGTGSLIRKSISSTETIFPIGTATAYSPAWITNSGTPGDYTINVVSDLTGTNNGDERVKLKWNIAGPASQPTKLRIGWLVSQEGTSFGNNRGTYAKLWHLNTNGTWTLAGDGENTLTAGNSEIVDWTLYSTNIQSFSPFGSGQNESAMPVTLSSLTNSVTGRNIKLNWTTTSEINNAGFNIERLGIRQQATGNWEKIGYVSGKGTTNTATNYSFDDRNLQTGKYKYRLKQIDHNGNFEYFSLNGEVEVGVPAKFDLSQNYPNPFNPVTKINFDLPFDSKVNISLYDITGREVKSLVNESRTAGYHTVQFNASDLSSGIYFYRIMTKSSAKDFVMTKKMAVIK